MAKIISEIELLSAVTNSSFIKRGLVSGIEGVKYDFHASTKILKAKFPVTDTAKFTATELAQLKIEPMEVVFILTEESLDLPSNMVAHLSPKRKLSHAGIITLGGLSVDPKYKGRLLVGLLNVTSTPFQVIPGKKLIAATFYKLDENECPRDSSNGSTESIEDFPDELIAVMGRYEPVGPNKMQESINSLHETIKKLEEDLRAHKNWYQVHENSLSRHDVQIDNLLKSLEKEEKLRKDGQDSLTKAIQQSTNDVADLKDSFKPIKWGIGILISAVTLIAIPVVVTWLTKKLGL